MYVQIQTEVTRRQIEMVKRVYVEKKSGFDVEAQSLYSDIKSNIHPEGLTGVRVINRYDVQGLDDESYEIAKYQVFAEPIVDEAYDEEMPDIGSANFFAVEYLPGQYDQRADSAAQCIKLIMPKAEPIVKFARVVVLEGDITEEEIEKIASYCINPVDSQFATMEKPLVLGLETTVPEDVPSIEGFINMTDDELESMRQTMGLAMSKEDIRFIRDYFKRDEKRNPTMTEIKVIDTYWSDHCRHTTFNTELKNIEFEDSSYGKMVEEAFNEYMDMRSKVYGDKDKDICFMDMASLGTKYLKADGKVNDLDESEEINACSIKVRAKINGEMEDWLVMFKNETHNHPTEIEPFGGAATCLGGAIRDPLSGRVYVYQAMRVTGAADPRKPIEETLPGKLPQKKITREAAAGYSSYGNQIGLATGLVDEVYDEDYVAKRMEIGAVIGAAPADHVVRERPSEGDAVILVGGRTGRDGCGGATGSSKEHTEDSINECGAEVQKGNPPVERNIQRLFRRKEVSTLIKRCNDFGAGGVSVAIGELADSLYINLDLVPKKYEGLDGTELAISESQERMAVVVSSKNEELFKKLAREENLEATTVARVTDDGRMRMTWRGNEILNLSREFLNTNGAKQTADVKIKGDAKNVFVMSGKSPEDYLDDINCCSRKGLIERFDSTIGRGTVLMPLGGKYQLSPAAGMAAKLPVYTGDTDTATLMAYGYDPTIAKRSPFHGAMYAVVDSVAKIVAMGGNYQNVRLTFQEYFEHLSDEESWGKPMAALLGALKVQKELEIPSIGGKDSMSGTFNDISVPPALVSFAVAVCDAYNVMSTELKKTGSKLVMISCRKNDNDLPDFDKFKEAMNKLASLIEGGHVMAANTIGRGGIFISLVKMAVGNKIGAKINVDSIEELLKPDYGNILLEMPADVDLEELFAPVTYKEIGVTTTDETISIKAGEEDLTYKLDDIIDRWEAPLESVYPVRTDKYKDTIEENVENISFTERLGKGPAIKTAEPRVVIPVFPGTNCEVDSKRAFEAAGAKATIHVINNLSELDLIESINNMSKLIKDSQIVMLPGGFSGGDEPDGSAKFITAVFRNPLISEAIMDLLENRDGLMLGICNGFQALVKLGLLPFGKIIEPSEDMATLTFNDIGRHQSQLIRTRVASVKSPWMSLCDVDDVHTIAISHGEGKFVASEEIIKNLIDNGQIATQYVDFDDKAAMDIKFNPNHSVMAIEGITSPDGRIFGKMAHTERWCENVFKNVPGNKEQKIFQAGVNYFK